MEHISGAPFGSANEKIWNMKYFMSKRNKMVNHILASTYLPIHHYYSSASLCSGLSTESCYLPHPKYAQGNFLVCLSVHEVEGGTTWTFLLIEFLH